MGSGRVFISHCSSDHAVAMDICARVERQGIRCWIAPRDMLPGEDWARRIGAEIDRAAGFVVVLSRSSNKSRAVKSETEIAFQNNGLPIFPVQIDDITLDRLDRGLRFFVGSSHIVDAQPALRHAAFDRMAQDIARTVLKGSRGPGRDPKPAPYADLAARVGSDGADFAKLWTAMDTKGARTAWLPEAFIGGLAWPFVRGMIGLGMAAAAIMALLVWTSGAIGGTGGAIAMLLCGWLAAALLFGWFGADLLRRFHAAKVQTHDAPSGPAARVAASLASAAALVVATVTPGSTLLAPEPDKPATGGGAEVATKPAADVQGPTLRHVDEKMTNRGRVAEWDLATRRYWEEQARLEQEAADAAAAKAEVEGYIGDVARDAAVEAVGDASAAVDAAEAAK